MAKRTQPKRSIAKALKEQLLQLKEQAATKAILSGITEIPMYPAVRVLGHRGNGPYFTLDLVLVDPLTGHDLVDENGRQRSVSYSVIPHPKDGLMNCGVRNLQGWYENNLPKAKDW